MKFFALIYLLPLLALGADPSETISTAANCVASPGVNCPSALPRRNKRSPAGRIVRIQQPKGTSPQTQVPVYLTNQAARMIIGQVTFTNQDIETTSGSLLGGAGGVAYAANRLFITDSNKIQATPVQNRVLIYNNVSSFIIPPTAEITQDLWPIELKGNQATVGK